MTIVLDDSALVSALVDTCTEASWPEAIIAEKPLVAPELIMAESSNILRRLDVARHETCAIRAVRKPRMGIAAKFDML